MRFFCSCTFEIYLPATIILVVTRFCPLHFFFFAPTKVCPERERLATVRGCKWVDEVVEGVPYVMSDEYLRYVIEKYRIDYVVHGDDPCIVDGKDVYESAVKMGTYVYTTGCVFYVVYYVVHCNFTMRQILVTSEFEVVECKYKLFLHQIE